jgi:putative FmdB family regulatory protein
MPFFDFECSKCGYTEEKLLQRSEIDTSFTCPDCKGILTRLMCCPEFKMAGAPPKNYQPLSKSQPKSQVRNINEIRRVEETK